MLTIQPKLLNTYRPAFKSNEEEEKPINIADMDEDTYESMRDDLEDQRDELEDLANNKDFKLPKPLNKALKGGAVVTTGLLGGMATGWGTKKSLGGLNKLWKSNAMKGFKKSLSGFKTKIKNVNTKIAESNFVAKIKNGWKKLGEKKLGKPVVNFFNSIGRGIKNIYNKIRGVKKETWEKATVNTVGVSGGVASGVTAAKEKSGADD